MSSGGAGSEGDSSVQFYEENGSQGSLRQRSATARSFSMNSEGAVSSIGGLPSRRIEEPGKPDQLPNSPLQTVDVEGDPAEVAAGATTFSPTYSGTLTAMTMSPQMSDSGQRLGTSNESNALLNPPQNMSGINTTATRQLDVGTPAAVQPAAAPSRSRSSTTRSSTTRSTPSPSPRYVRLYTEGLDSKLAIRQWACTERLRNIQNDIAAEGCTFSPSISSYAQRIRRPRSLSPEHRAQTEISRRNERLSVLRAKVIERELDGCTFRPLTLRRRSASMENDPRPIHVRLHDVQAEREEWRVHQEAEMAAEYLEKFVNRRLTRETIPADEADAVVERLQSWGRQKDELLETERNHKAAPVRPFVCEESKKIFEARRQRLNEPEDIVQRLLERPSPYQTVAQSLPQHQRKPYVSAESKKINDKARLRALHTIFALLDRGNHGVINPQEIEAVDRIKAISDRDAEALKRILKSCSLDVALDVHQFCAAVMMDAETHGPPTFVSAGWLKHHNDTEKENSRTHRPILSKESQRIAAEKRKDSIDIVERLLKRAVKKKQDTEEARRNREKEDAEKEVEGCTFHPDVNSKYVAPPPVDPAKYLPQKSQKQIPKTDVAPATPTSMSSEPSEPLDEPAKPIAVARNITSGATAPRGGCITIEPASSRHAPAQERLAERALRGNLHQYGRQLMRNQLVDLEVGAPSAHAASAASGGGYATRARTSSAGRTKTAKK